MCTTSYKRVLIIGGGFYRNTGGPSIVVADLIEALIKLGYSVTVFMPKGDIHPKVGRIIRQNNVDLVNYAGFGRYEFNPFQVNILTSLLQSTDIVWVHGLFQWPTLLGLVLARILKTKGIITPHGILTAGMMRNKRWKKLLFSWPEMLIIRRSYNFTIHFLSPREKQESRMLGVNDFVLPNIVDFDEQANPHDGSLCFIGRLHKIKGIEDILRINNCPISIYGYDEGGYEREISKSSNLQYKGLLNHDEVASTLRNYEGFLLPSYGEGLPTSAIEAALSGRILIISYDTNLSEYTDGYDCIMFQSGLVGLEEALQRFRSMTNEQKRQMRRKSLRTVKEFYGRKSVTDKLSIHLDEILHE